MGSQGVEVYSQEGTIGVGIGVSREKELAVLQGGSTATFSPQDVNVFDQAVAKNSIII